MAVKKEREKRGKNLKGGILPDLNRRTRIKLNFTHEYYGQTD
jgi:hypothetical protein